VDWNPKIVCYVSPQLWAWHESRVYQIGRDVDLMLSIFPFEKEWYAKRSPKLPVEYVGHPLIDRYRQEPGSSRLATDPAPPSASFQPSSSLPLLLLLPGSRAPELKSHLPVMLDAAKRIAATQPIRLRMVLPDEQLAQEARKYSPAIPALEVTSNDLAQALSEAHVAIAASGTVTMECAYFGVPTVVIYKTSWSTYLLGKQFIKVKFLAMPNLLANEQVYPELIQGNATAENISKEILNLMNDAARRASVKAKLRKVIESLGPPGANRSAARAIIKLLINQGNVKLLPAR
jgi:lipid-A-disaccharide synthase